MVQINLTHRLEHFSRRFPQYDRTQLHKVLLCVQEQGADVKTCIGVDCIEQALTMLDCIAELNVDQTTLLASLFYLFFRYTKLTLTHIRENSNNAVMRLVRGVDKLSAVKALHEEISTRKINRSRTTDNLRKMLLAMVTDTRVVLIKLVEYLAMLHHAKSMSEAIKHSLALETRDLYAPLANRLGIGHLKWQLEDFAFRYLEPNEYKKISSALNERRIDRERFAKDMVKTLSASIAQLGIKGADVTGRAKHIFSIYKKMQRKGVDLSQIYDATALRVLVNDLADCYTLLGHVHTLWKPISAEFDDYIAKPKSNGYRSLHTAVVGPGGRNIEIQVRTYEMHQEAELGVAAHWIYKEQGSGKSAYDDKIATLRQVMSWQKSVLEQEEDGKDLEAQVLDDRIYVFTPNGDVIDLARGCTPLDFAYHIHTDVGHRCRGAKVNGRIVPLTHPLETGDRVTVLTARQGQPSRDWLAPHSGYLYSTQARNKVQVWFRKQDYERYVELGRELLERELKRLRIRRIDYSALADKMNCKHVDDLMAGIGRGEFKLPNVLSTQTSKPIESAPEDAASALPTETVSQKKQNVPISIEGIGQLVTHRARCCDPKPGEEIIGYVTVARGVTIHRKNCPSLKRRTCNPDRLLVATWC